MAIQSGSQEEIRLRAAMMASVDEGVGQLLDELTRSGQLDNTVVMFLGDNGAACSVVDLARQTQRLDSALLESSMIKEIGRAHV